MGVMVVRSATRLIFLAGVVSVVPRASEAQRNVRTTFNTVGTSPPGVTFTAGARSVVDTPTVRTITTAVPDAVAAVRPVCDGASRPRAEIAPRTSQQLEPPDGANDQEAAMSPSPWCQLDGAIRHVDLDARGLRATQVALAARNGRVVALVVMARNAPPRAIHSGLVFPESRLVTDDGHSVTVAHALGVEPDTAIALTQADHVFVASYEQPADALRTPGTPPGVRVVVLDAQGHVAFAPRTIEGSAGLQIDSTVVPYGAGAAVVLGRESVLVGGAHGPVDEALYLFDETGSALREPARVTDAQGDETLSRHRVGLASGANSEGLRATWSVPSGPESGVWTSRFDGTRFEAGMQVTSRGAWGTEVSGDGAGVLFRGGGEQGRPVGLFYRAFDLPTAELALGVGWDPEVAMTQDVLLVAGVSLHSATGRAVYSAIAAARPGEPLRPVTTPELEGATLADAIDLAMVSLRDGAAVGWIEPGSAQPEATGRRLGLARVTCR